MCVVSSSRAVRFHGPSSRCGTDASAVNMSLKVVSQDGTCAVHTLGKACLRRRLRTDVMYVTSSDGTVMRMGGFATKPVQVWKLYVLQLLRSPKTAYVNSIAHKFSKHGKHELHSIEIVCRFR